jgi:hypothetical protein
LFQPIEERYHQELARFAIPSAQQRNPAQIYACLR